MKSTRAIVMILLSLLAGALAVWLAARWIAQQAAENVTRVVVAARDLDAGQVLSADMLQSVAWPSVSVPVGATGDLKKIEGRVLGVMLVKGEPVLEARLAPVGATGGLSSTIQKGKRAISIQVNEIVGVAGYIRPGSWVDVMVNTREASGDKPISKIVLEKILVLAVAQDDKRDQTKPKVVSTVTLEVEPEQAEKIDLARNIGNLSLVLRNPLDTADISTSGARREGLLRGDAVPGATAPAQASAHPVARPAVARPTVAARPASPAAAPVPPAVQVEVIRGVQKANSNF